MKKFRYAGLRRAVAVAYMDPDLPDPGTSAFVEAEESEAIKLQRPDVYVCLTAESAGA